MAEGTMKRVVADLKQRFHRWWPTAPGIELVRPEAIARELLRVAHRQQVGLGSEGIYVPCRYVVALPPADLRHMEEVGARELVEKSLVQSLREFINEKGFLLNGGLQVQLTVDGGLESGSIGIDFRFSPESRQAPRPGGDDATATRLISELAVVRIQVLDGPQKGTCFPIDSFPATLGRSKQPNQVTVGLRDCPAYRMVSRHHARIERDDNRWCLVDTQSSNGTWLNGEPLQAEVPYPMTEGDHIRLADQVSLRFHVRDEGWTLVVKAQE